MNSTCGQGELPLGAPPQLFWGQLVTECCVLPVGTYLSAVPPPPPVLSCLGHQKKHIHVLSSESTNLTSNVLARATLHSMAMNSRCPHGISRGRSLCRTLFFFFFLSFIHYPTGTCLSTTVDAVSSRPPRYICDASTRNLKHP